MAVHAVKFHLKNIYLKLNVTNRVREVAVLLSAIGQPP